MRDERCKLRSFERSVGWDGRCAGVMMFCELVLVNFLGEKIHLERSNCVQVFRSLTRVGVIWGFLPGNSSNSGWNFRGDLTIWHLLLQIAPNLVWVCTAADLN